MEVEKYIGYIYLLFLFGFACYALIIFFLFRSEEDHDRTEDDADQVVYLQDYKRNKGV